MRGKSRPLASVFKGFHPRAGCRVTRTGGIGAEQPERVGFGRQVSLACRARLVVFRFKTEPHECFATEEWQ